MGPCLRTGRRRRFPLWVCECVGGMFGGGLCQFDEMSLSGNACLSQQTKRRLGRCWTHCYGGGCELAGTANNVSFGKLGYHLRMGGPQTFVPKQ